jgi:hypothetical protein
MIKLGKRFNMPGIVFSICFLLITIFRWSRIETVDRIFYCFAVVGLVLIGIAPLFNMKKPIVTS